MKRGILFRGKDTDTGRWYEGFYMALSDTTYCFKEDYDRHPDNTKHYIVFDQMTDWCLPNRHLQAEVDPTTVGQYTGLNDKNGKRIFDGDIVRHYNNERDPSAFEIGVICWNEKYASFERTSSPEAVRVHSSCRYDVIGNIHDNHDLLE